eukprot:TRINITY_DN12240_c0_g1_i1.p1 TRINITY_DN12240_c0_g1~~TRINITY_DN12240_c0_g1_i1.p1  ORF type:complete len:447 (+),score=167.53 TRINITY_DN12240_c0_g1_i1:60-1400(+)
MLDTILFFVLAGMFITWWLFYDPLKKPFLVNGEALISIDLDHVGEVKDRQPSPISPDINENFLVDTPVVEEPLLEDVVDEPMVEDTIEEPLVKDFAEPLVDASVVDEQLIEDAHPVDEQVYVREPVVGEVDPIQDEIQDTEQIETIPVIDNEPVELETTSDEDSIGDRIENIDSITHEDDAGNIPDLVSEADIDLNTVTEVGKDVPQEDQSSEKEPENRENTLLNLSSLNDSLEDLPILKSLEESEESVGNLEDSTPKIDMDAEENKAEAIEITQTIPLGSANIAGNIVSIDEDYHKSTEGDENYDEQFYDEEYYDEYDEEYYDEEYFEEEYEEDEVDTEKIPQSPKRKMDHRKMFRAKYDFQGDPNLDQLSYKFGDIVYLLEQDEDGWWYGELRDTKQEGFFYKDYFGPYSEYEAKSKKADTSKMAKRKAPVSESILRMQRLIKL